MKRLKSWMGIALMLMLVSPAWAGGGSTSVPAPPGRFQAHFDAMGAPVQALAMPGGRIVHYADTGEANWRPVLFLGGTGTSARAFLMADYLETLRRQLHLRLITVERNGFGDTDYDPGWTYGDYTSEVRAVLDHLGIGRFAMVAISGGGPYAAHIAAAMPGRLISVHVAAALANVRPASLDLCHQPLADTARAIGPMVQNPQTWWNYPANSPTHRIPGFAERADDEGARTFFIRGQMGDPTSESAEIHRYCSDLPADLRAVKAPLFTYYGTIDQEVVPANGIWWRQAVGGPVTERAYAGEGHDVQYRHWDQILIDMAGFGARLLVCRHGRAHLVPARVGRAWLARGAYAGLCLWGG